MRKEESLVLVNTLDKGDKYFPKEWLAKLLNSPDKIRDKAYLVYQAQTGLRVSEVVMGTMISHIDWENCRTHTYDFKKDKWRWVYWPPSVKPIIKMWLKERQNKNIKSDRLFPFTTKTANRIIKRWSKSISFPFASVVSTHWLRHTFIRLSQKEGRSIKAVQQNTGDKIETLLGWYSDLGIEDLKEEIRKEI